MSIYLTEDSNGNAGQRIEADTQQEAEIICMLEYPELQVIGRLVTEINYIEFWNN